MDKLLDWSYIIDLAVKIEGLEDKEKLTDDDIKKIDTRITKLLIQCLKEDRYEFIEKKDFYPNRWKYLYPNNNDNNYV